MPTQQKTVYKKRGRGRPPGQTYANALPIRLAPSVIEKVDDWADRSGVSRSEAIRRLVELGLKGKKR